MRIISLRRWILSRFWWLLHGRDTGIASPHRERTQSWLKLLESYQQNRDKSEIKDNELLALLPYLKHHLALAIQRLSLLVNTFR